MTRTHDQKWLEANAMFSCQINECREEVSYHAQDLRLHPEGGVICESCYDFECNGTTPDWSDLKDFNPFGESK